MPEKKTQGKKNRKIGKNLNKAARYKLTGRREKNKKRKMAKRERSLARRKRIREGKPIKKTPVRKHTMTLGPEDYIAPDADLSKERDRFMEKV